MPSKYYKRAQSMTLRDKYHLSKTQFFEEVAELARRYFELDSITVDAFDNDDLAIVINMSVKKVKDLNRVGITGKRNA